MNWYVVKLKMQSASGTKWQADTIFGHLCWAFYYLEGPKALEDFLEYYQEGIPPLLVSNGFPGDLLPQPLLLPTPVLIKGKLCEQIAKFEEEKQRKKRDYLKVEDFDKILQGEIFIPSATENQPKSRATLKNQISRLTGTTGGEGQLFTFEEHFWAVVTIYLKIEGDFVDTVKELFQYLKDVGYGKRKTVGYGQIKEISFEAFKGFSIPSNTNGFVSLSNFVPAPNDPLNGSWRLMAKYGKLSEGYSAEKNIFKNPILMMEAGSTFYDSPCKEFYGRLINGLAKDNDEVIHYAFALPVPMKLPILQ